MTENQRDQNTVMHFSELLDRFERDQSSQNVQINDLTKNVSALAATVDTLAEQQRNLFGRANRPFPWGAAISSVALLVMFSTLALTPVNRDIQRGHQFHVKLMGHLEDDAEIMGEMKTDIEWLKTLEARLHGRLHKAAGK